MKLGTRVNCNSLPTRIGAPGSCVGFGLEAECKPRRKREALAPSIIRRKAGLKAKASPWVKWELTDDGFHRQEDHERLAIVRDEGGKYALQTNVTDLPGQDAAVAYRQLEAVEDCFRHLKDTLRLRPIYHRDPHRVKGHIGLCVVALFLLRLLRERPFRASICTTATEALAAVSELQAVPATLGDRELWQAAHITTKVAAIFRALDIPDTKARFVADLQALNKLPD